LSLDQRHADVRLPVVTGGDADCRLRWRYVSDSRYTDDTHHANAAWWFLIGD
jgi:hypothetical protein